MARRVPLRHALYANEPRRLRRVHRRGRDRGPRRRRLRDRRDRAHRHLDGRRERPPVRAVRLWPSGAGQGSRRGWPVDGERRRSPGAPRERCQAIHGRGACHHPDGVVRLVRSALEVFRHDAQAHAQRSARARAPIRSPVRDSSPRDRGGAMAVTKQRASTCASTRSAATASGTATSWPPTSYRSTSGATPSSAAPSPP